MEMRQNLPLLVWICLAAALAGCGGGGNDAQPQSSSLAPAEVRISAPRDGAIVPAGEPVTIRYEAKLSPRGDHLHISVDGGKPDIVKQVKGAHTIGPLPAGIHTVLVTEVTSEHIPTGNDASIRITAQ